MTQAQWMILQGALNLYLKHQLQTIDNIMQGGAYQSESLRKACQERIDTRTDNAGLAQDLIAAIRKELKPI